MNIVILAETIGLGFGVSVVVMQQAKGLAQMGHIVTLLHIEGEGWKNPPTAIRCFKVRRHFKGLKSILSALNTDVAIAHTPPFMQFLSQSIFSFKTIVWEHGDPNPNLFLDGTAGLRQKAKEDKVKYVYSAVDHVVAISHFIKEEIHWPAQVIYNGVDHLVSAEFSDQNTVGNDISFLCISRLGKEEENYKGTQAFAELAQRVKSVYPNWSFILAGKGSVEDVKRFSAYPISVYPSVSDTKLCELLRNCKGLISLSKWEGFNLPLVEAQMNGKMALALNFGAHREVTPWVFQSLTDLEQFLLETSQWSDAEKWVKSKAIVRNLTWENHTLQVDKLLHHLVPKSRFIPMSMSKKITLSVILKTWKMEEFLKSKMRKFVR